jgi:hypothetical protein
MTTKQTKIVVCGDSYCSADNTRERWHFSQILNDHYGMHVINLARSGISNLGICFQLKQAIELGPDIIIYNQTDPGRVDIVMNPATGKYSLKEFIYPYPYDSSFLSPYVGRHNAAIFSTVHQGLEQQQHIHISPEKITAVKHYLAHLFDWKLKFETDSWWFSHWQEQIDRAQIDSINLTSFSHVDDQNPIGKIMYNFVKANPGWPKLYHTNQSTQEQVACELVKQIEKILLKA